MTRRAHPLLFAAAAGALLASALVLASGDRGGAPRSDRLASPDPVRARPQLAPTSIDRESAAPSAAVEDLPPGVLPQAALSRQRRAIEATARRFLPAFWSYEVGDLAPRVIAALRAGATPEFAGELLAASPRPTGTGSLPPRARLRGFEIAFVSGPALTAELRGTVRRGRRIDGFAFSFERRGSRWLASGVAE